MNSSTARCNGLVLVAALLITGCATSETIVGKPTVALTGVEISKLGFSSQTFLLQFRVENPNAFSLPVASIKYKIQFDDENFASGDTPASFSIPARGEGAFAISVETDFLGKAAQITSLLSGGVPEYVEYELQGSLDVDIPLVKPLAFTSAGVIPIEKKIF